ncbi:signal peptide containing protein [Theileria equi strain WA]|uniref:Signal peptide containing protein n=1 Tax=Theileria equi strain WA TaxID=1537102 RepID=L1LAT7_THEEQ|nr:signal peptide containing protein [Theileria equi strain WA]EKX72395.1 signal peptide containing protein [Theileria equi strain WA]|eukprot:XP_004831847.1 signal peptide containing protein [Theileria equi strain WA]
MKFPHVFSLALIVVDGGVTLWEGKGEERCTGVSSKSVGDSVLLTLSVLPPGGKLGLRYYVKHNGEWRALNNGFNLARYEELQKAADAAKAAELEEEGDSDYDSDEEGDSEGDGDEEVEEVEEEELTETHVPHLYEASENGGTGE